MATTETASLRFADVDLWPAADLVDGILEGQFAAIAAVHAAQPALAKAIEATVQRLRHGGRLIYAGAGTSGRIAALDAAELPPTFGWPAGRAIALLAGSDRAMQVSAESAEDDGEAARKTLAGLGLCSTDVVIGIAASGRTPYAISALEEARRCGALAIGLTNNAGSKLGAAGDIAIVLETGPEFVAGSTRMKAGTAQKAALTCFSTAVMIRLGLVYRGRMVDMTPANEKLKARAVAMVCELTGSPPGAAQTALAETGGGIKLAIVMIQTGLPLAQARDVLKAADGNLRQALK